MAFAGLSAVVEAMLPQPGLHYSTALLHFFLSQVLQLFSPSFALPFGRYAYMKAAE